MIQLDLDPEVTRHLSRLESDRIDTFLLHGGSIRGSLLHGSSMINFMRENHGTGILETCILGHAYIAAGLLTAMVKGRDRIGISIECGGPVKGLYVEAAADGAVRGYLKQNPIPIDAPPESFDTSPYFGPGFISVIRTLEGAKHPVSGQTMMKHGSIAKDLANHFLESEQMPTLFFLSVQFAPTGMAIGAGGLFLQVMPGAKPRFLDEVEAAACSMPSLGQWFAKGGSSSELITSAFGEFSPEVIGTRSVGFFCSCERNRFLSFVGSLSGETRESILSEGPFPLELVCHNCATTYAFDREELELVFSGH